MQQVLKTTCGFNSSEIEKLNFSAKRFDPAEVLPNHVERVPPSMLLVPVRCAVVDKQETTLNDVVAFALQAVRGLQQWISIFGQD